MVNVSNVRDTLLKLLAMNTPSGREGAEAHFVEQELRGMGFTTWRDQAGQAIGGETGNVLARLEGTATGAPPLLFNAHMDTVAPTERLVVQEAGGILRSAGDTILGADDKAGVTAILEGIRAALAEGFPRPTLEVVFTVSEENGLRGAKHLDYSSLTAHQAYVLDSGRPVGGIVVAAPSQNSLHVKIHGVAAHAGAAPEKGINAIRIAAEAIVRMPLGRIDEETTANIGVIRGGQATNIVPDLVECRGEARSRNEEKLERQTQAMVEAFQQAATEAGGRAEVEVVRMYTRFAVAHDDPIVLRAVEAARRAGIDNPEIRAGGGGSDANVFHQHGIRAVVLGLGCDNAHSTEEWVSLQDVATASQMVVELIRLAGQEPGR